MTPDLTTPVTFGILKPTILLPAEFERLAATQQEAILCHELVHISRHDWWAVLFEETVRAFLWFHPFVWILLRRIGLCREQVVDQEVVRLTGQRHDYLEALLGIARGSVEPRRALATTFVHRNDLQQRVHSLIKETSMSKTHLRASVSVALTTLLLSAAAAGLAFPLTPRVDTAPETAPSARGDGVGIVDDSSNGIEGPIHVTGSVIAPQRLQGSAPAYTDEARQAKLQGIVILRVIVDTQGAVVVDEVLKALPMGLAEKAAEAAESWTFSPATLDGKPIPVYYNLTFNFRLSNEDPSPVASGDQVKEAPSIQPPVLQYSTPATYTASAREAGIEGSVVLHLTVDATGVVQNVEVLRGLPMGLGEAAAAAAYDWRFLPAISAGEPIVATVTLEVDFSL